MALSLLISLCLSAPHNSLFPAVRVESPFLETRGHGNSQSAAHSSPTGAQPPAPLGAHSSLPPLPRSFLPPAEEREKGQLHVYALLLHTDTPPLASSSPLPPSLSSFCDCLESLPSMSWWHRRGRLLRSPRDKEVRPRGPGDERRSGRHQQRPREGPRFRETDTNEERQKGDVKCGGETQKQSNRGRATEADGKRHRLTETKTETER